MTGYIVHVVVPAHDEEELLGACLVSVATAAARLLAEVPGIAVRTTVVLDRCTDGTAAIAATYDVDTVVVGAVHPDPADLPLGALERWRERHRRPEAHVHGANLALTLAAYARSGGLRPVDLHEDVRPVTAMRAAGCRWTTGTSVQTSGRTTSRVRGGFASYLAALVMQPE
jgi:hypothetical protein